MSEKQKKKSDNQGTKPTASGGYQTPLTKVSAKLAMQKKAMLDPLLNQKRQEKMM